MSTIESIGRALRYDACEAALASGAPLSTVLALAVAATDRAEDRERAPVSAVAPTEIATVRPAK